MDPWVTEPDRQAASGEGERQWLEAFRRGRPDAFQGLLRPHLRALLSLARRHTTTAQDAEELLQEVLVRAHRGLHGFRGDSGLRTWLFRILVRLASEPQRWRSAGRSPQLDEAAVPDVWVDPPDQAAIARELSQRLEEAMERLPPRQRSALHLRAVEGLDYAAIAAVLECSAGAARMLVLEARRKVMARIGEHLDP